MYWLDLMYVYVWLILPKTQILNRLIRITAKFMGQFQRPKSIPKFHYVMLMQIAMNVDISLFSEY